ncbi:hypothetical protein F2Q69_00059165 [Brassica cretica]|uniref:Uncharacterized protein n=1 Tax=Brassica cretica TaxID=69181 RepID=A0A8S9RPG0_BRACR|nr:hypothetical protein F2Q69_00059165 [Brassica cretica]
MTGTRLLDELAQAVRSLVLFFQSNYVRLDSRKGYMQSFIRFSPISIKTFFVFCYQAASQLGLSRKTLDQNDVWKYERKNLHNNAGKTTPAATAPMANAYANATVLE